MSTKEQVVKATLLEGDPEDLTEVPVRLSAEASAQDLVTLWATRRGAEGNAAPGLELTARRARDLAAQLTSAAERSSADAI